MTTTSRRQFLARSTRGVVALAVAGAALDALGGNADAALPSGDLAYARLLVGAELLGMDFYSQAIAAANSGPRVAGYLKRAYFNEAEHYQSVAGILSGAGVTPAISSDITFSYPRGTFASEASIVAFASKLERVMLGAYLGAVGGIQTTSFLQGIAEIAACEAQHAGCFASLGGGEAFRLSFPPALTIEQASDAMAAYTA
ncbi:MAG TPA: ferritin-like domain-containing protein [Gaiellaceae bacterium]|nr:ferritin-like domain-containing protein [Gaiellaceae bacterium]